MTVFLRLCKCTNQAHDVSSNPPLSSTIACPTVNPPTSSRVPTLTNIYKTRLRLWNGQNPMKRRWVIMFFSFWMYRNTRDLTHHLQIDVFKLKQMPPNYTSLLSTPKGINQCASPAHPSLALPTAITASCDIKKIRTSHLCPFRKPVLLLWWSHQLLLTFLRPRIDHRRDCLIGTVQIGPEEGEMSCFVWLHIMKLHVNSPIHH
jgi:hypothetical protein